MAQQSRQSLMGVAMRLYGSFAGKVAIVGVPQPGLEFTLPVNRMHGTLPESRMHGTLPVNRMHATVPEDD